MGAGSAKVYAMGESHRFLATELGVTCAAFTASGGVATLVDQVWDVRSTVQPLRLGLWAPLRAPFGAVFATWGDDEEVAAWLEGADPSARAGHLDALRAGRERGYVVELRRATRELPGGTGDEQPHQASPARALSGSHQPR